MTILSARIKTVPPSETLALAARAAKLRAEGKKIISFAAGELDFPTPIPFVTETISALHEGWTRYAPSAGLPDLRSAAASYMSSQCGVEVKEENVAITTGAKQAIFNVLMSVLDPGDRVLILSPYWVSYPPMIALAGGEAHILETSTESGFKTTASQIESEVLRTKPKAAILNSPCNPTGSVYDEKELRSICHVFKEAGVFVISDEIYSTLVFDGQKHFSLLRLAGKAKDHFCVIGGMSKSFSMTGWRIGWVVATPDLVDAVSRVTAQTTSCATTFIQKGCAAALTKVNAVQKEWVAKLEQRRNRMLALLGNVDRIRCHRPQGAFYLWVDARELLAGHLPDGRKVGTSVELSSFLIEKAGLVVVPGSAFGCEGFLRFSFAASMEEIEEGVKRFESAINMISS